MFLKKCEFCNDKIETKYEVQRFCNSKCQSKDYRSKPENKEKFRIWTREYRKRHPEWKERHRILAVTKNREKRAKYWKEYGKRPEVRARIRERENLRRKTDLEYAVSRRLRRSFRHALSRYLKTGEAAHSKKYGIDWKAAIESLKPFPNNLENFEVDHIIPLCTFDFSDLSELRKAFAPSNLQWLTRTENRRKSGKIMTTN